MTRTKPTAPSVQILSFAGQPDAQADGGLDDERRLVELRDIGGTCQTMITQLELP